MRGDFLGFSEPTLLLVNLFKAQQLHGSDNSKHQVSVLLHQLPLNVNAFNDRGASLVYLLLSPQEKAQQAVLRILSGPAVVSCSEEDSLSELQQYQRLGGTSLRDLSGWGSVYDTEYSINSGTGESDSGPQANSLAGPGVGPTTPPHQAGSLTHSPG